MLEPIDDGQRNNASITDEIYLRMNMECPYQTKPLRSSVLTIAVQ